MDSFATARARLVDINWWENELTSPAPGIDDVSWDPRTLGNGYLGMVLSHVFSASRPSRLSDDAVRLVKAAGDAATQVPFESLGLFDGAAGMRYVLTRLASVDARLETSARRFTETYLTASLDHRDESNSSQSESADIISGAAGELLAICAEPVVPSSAQSTLVDALVARVTSTALSGSDGPLYAFKSPWSPSGEPTPDDLWAQTGLAHGSAGALLALASALDQGHESARRGVEVLVLSFLDGSEQQSSPRRWPRAVSEQDGEVVHHGPLPAWCNSNAGIELALLRAGEALDDHSLALSSALHLEGHLERAAVHHRPWREPSLCHGWAGALVLHYATRAHVAPDRWVANHRRLRGALTDLAAGSRPLGFTSRDRAGSAHDDPTFLMGAGGTLALVARGDDDLPPAWTQLLIGGRS